MYHKVIYLRNSYELHITIQKLYVELKLIRFIASQEIVLFRGIMINLSRLYFQTINFSNTSKL